MFWYILIRLQGLYYTVKLISEYNTYSVSFPTRRCHYSIHPIMVVLQITKHNGVIIYNHWIDSDNFVLRFCWVGCSTGMRLTGCSYFDMCAESIHKGLYTACLTAAGGPSNNYTYKKFICFHLIMSTNFKFLFSVISVIFNVFN